MTHTQNPLRLRYYLYRMFTNMFFFGSVWLYFYRMFINDQQLGIIDSIAFTIGLIAEVPAGALADKFGRHRMVRIGQFLFAAGIIVQISPGGFHHFWIGQAIMMIGASFVSGADEALFFEKLKLDTKSHQWRNLVMRGSQFALIGSLIATVIGGYTHTIEPRIPWILTSMSFIMAIMVIWPLRDTRIKDKTTQITTGIASYIQTIKLGFAQFRRPELLPYVPIILIIQSLFYATGWGILRMILLSRFHFSPFWGAVAVASCSLLAVGILHGMHKYAHKLSERKVLTFVALLAAGSFLFSIPDVGWWGYVAILGLYVGEHVLFAFMSEILNKHAPENQRATVLSVASFMKVFPYIFIAPMIGYLNHHQHLGYFLFIAAIAVIITIMYYNHRLKREAYV